MAVPFGAVVRNKGVCASGGHPSLRPPVVHRPRTAESLAGLYRESCAIVLRHYRRPLTVAVVARALASSPRQVQRASDEVGGPLQRRAARGAAAPGGRAALPAAIDCVPGLGSVRPRHAGRVTSWAATAIAARSSAMS